MIGHIDILYSGQISGTTITGESISVSSVTVNNIISSGNTFSKFNLLSATTLSATTIQSAGLVGGGTQMVIANSDGVLSVQAIPVVGQSTVIRNGLNTYTAGTTADYSVNISALTINTLTASGNSVFTGTLSGGSLFSASTIFSGTSNLDTLFITQNQLANSQTFVQPGTNTYTGGTSTRPTVNVSALTISTLTASGNSIFTGTLSGGSSFSANTIFSGTSNVNSLFSTIDHTHFGGIGFTIDAGNSVISTGYKGCVIIPFNATIRSWTIVADTTGSIVVDVWKDTYGNYPPVSGDTISGTEKITLSNQQKNQDLLLTSWATSISSGDILAFNVESVASVKKVYVMISVLKN